MLIPEPKRLWMWGNQLHPDDPRVNVNLCMRIQRSELNSVKSTSSVLSAEQTTKCIRPFRKPGPSKQTYLREADTSSVLFNKQTPQSEAIKSQQKETETIDQPGWSLPLSPDVSKGSETDEAVWTGNRLLCPPVFCYNTAFAPLCVFVKTELFERGGF